MHTTSSEIESEFILSQDNLNELLNQYQISNDKQDGDIINIQDSESDDGILSMEVNPLFQKKYKDLSEFNLLRKENYEKLLREIKLKKSNKEKIIIDLTKEDDEEIIKLKFSKNLNKKMKRTNSIIHMPKNIVVNLIRDESPHIRHIDSIPDFFNYNTPSDNLFLVNSLEDHAPLTQRVSILSYNIQSQQFIKKQKLKKELFLHNRMSTITDQIKLISSDILCLQEVDTKALNQHLIRNLKNYCFYFAQNYGSYFNNVIAFKSEKFALIHMENLNLKGINIKSNRGVFKMILEIKKNKTPIVVYNIHLPWKPKYIYHKFEILGMIAADVLRTCQKHIIIAGDFNSTPDSILLKLFHDKYFVHEKIRNIVAANCNTDRAYILNRNNIVERSYNRFEEHDSENDSYEEDNFTRETPDEDQKRKIENDSEMFKKFSILRSEYKFKSAYDDYKSLQSSTNKGTSTRKLFRFEKNHPEFTYFTENFRNTIDYIFYSNTFMLKKILKIPSREQVSTEGFLPSSKFPSDHLMIAAQFDIKN